MQPRQGDSRSNEILYQIFKGYKETREVGRRAIATDISGGGGGAGEGGGGVGGGAGEGRGGGGVGGRGAGGRTTRNKGRQG